MTTIEIHNNCIKYKYNNKLHRTDGPAEEHVTGTKYWYLHGKLHREDGPNATTYTDGMNEWRCDGLLHREYGPAVEYDDGGFKYCINGIRHRTDGPAIKSFWDFDDDENFQWDYQWYMYGKLHYEDGPAVYRDGYIKEWYLHGKRHREDGPAIEWKSGRKEYWLCGVKYSLEEYLKLLKL